ncbi:MAG: asparaginase [Pseudomonadota bacterium]
MSASGPVASASVPSAAVPSAAVPSSAVADRAAPPAPAPLAEVWRGDFTESVHVGHAVVCTPSGEIVEAWGDPARITLPRSAVKMIQALPLLESGAADAFRLGTERLALACASHSGAPMHVERVRSWLDGLGLGDDALRCGPQPSGWAPERDRMIRAGEAPGQAHNNCSGKHTGFLTLAAHLRAGPEYVEPDHPVQIAAREAMAEMTGDAGLGFGVDGCSAPNFAATLQGLAWAMARMARPAEAGLGRARTAAAERLVTAMATHPELVSGEGRACAGFMRALADASGGGGGLPAAVKTGAEGVFCAILPAQGLGIALKIEDGATRASECAMAALLARLGAVEASDPRIAERLRAGLPNRRGLPVAGMRPAAGLV